MTDNKLIKSIAKSIERELGFTNGWHISNEQYAHLCLKVSGRILKRLKKHLSK